ncbi:hypothetical protein BDW68DRAFT_142012 [Aspergillus falconensis]
MAYAKLFAALSPQVIAKHSESYNSPGAALVLLLAISKRACDPRAVVEPGWQRDSAHGVRETAAYCYVDGCAVQL